MKLNWWKNIWNLKIIMLGDQWNEEQTANHNITLIKLIYLLYMESVLRQKKRQIVAITKNKSYPKPLFLQSKVGFLQKISYQYHTAREREFVSFHIFQRQWDAVECKHDFPLEINCLDNYSTILTSIHCSTNSKNLAKVSFRAWKSVYILLLPLIYLRLLGLCSIW